MLLSLSKFPTLLFLLACSLSTINLAFASPAPATTPLPSSSCPDGIEQDCNRPADASVYLCANTNFEPPCQLIRLSTSNGEQYDWNSAPLGSLGPAPGIHVTLFSMWTKNSTSLSYPGTPDIGDFWGSKLEYFIASWDPSGDLSTLPNTNVGRAVGVRVAAPTAVAVGVGGAEGEVVGAGGRMGKVKREMGVDGSDQVERPWWIEAAWGSI